MVKKIHTYIKIMQPSFHSLPTPSLLIFHLTTESDTFSSFSSMDMFGKKTQTKGFNALMQLNSQFSNFPLKKKKKKDQ